MNIQSQPSQFFSSSRDQTRIILWSAILTGLCLGGALSFPFWYGLILYYAPSSIGQQLARFLSPDTTPDFWLQSVVLGGVMWGLALAHLSNVQPAWRLGVAGGIGILLAGIIATSATFIGLHRALWPDVLPHLRWTMELVFGLGLGGGITALALGLAMRWRRAALGLALGVVLAAALPALFVALSLDAIGIRWDAGNANMAKIVGLTFPPSTVGAGAWIGWYLARFSYQP